MVLPYINMNPPQVYTCSPSWTPLPAPSPYHPSGSSQCTSPKHPVSCIEPGLAIRFIYDIIHVSMPFSQIFNLGKKREIHIQEDLGSSITQSCPTLCNPMDCSTPGLPVHHQLPEPTQTHVHCMGDAIQPFHPLSSPSPSWKSLMLFQHQGLFQWVSSSHQVTKVLEF